MTEFKGRYIKNFVKIFGADELLDRKDLGNEVDYDSEIHPKWNALVERGRQLGGGCSFVRFYRPARSPTLHCR